MADVPVDDEELMRLFLLAILPCDDEDQENLEQCLMDIDSTVDESKTNDGLSGGSESVTFEGLMADLLEDFEAACKEKEVDDDIELILAEILKDDAYSFPSKPS